MTTEAVLCSQAVATTSLSRSAISTFATSSNFKSCDTRSTRRSVGIEASRAVTASPVVFRAVRKVFDAAVMRSGVLLGGIPDVGIDLAVRVDTDSLEGEAGLEEALASFGVLELRRKEPSMCFDPYLGL